MSKPTRVGDLGGMNTSALTSARSPDNSVLPSSGQVPHTPASRYKKNGNDRDRSSEAQ
jgi:hypothetical protein